MHLIISHVVHISFGIVLSFVRNKSLVASYILVILNCVRKSCNIFDKLSNIIDSDMREKLRRLCFARTFFFCNLMLLKTHYLISNQCFFLFYILIYIITLR